MRRQNCLKQQEKRLRRRKAASSSHRKAHAELAQMFFDEIYKGSNVLVFGEDRAGEGCVAAAFAVVDRSVLLDELPAVNPAVRNKEDRMARIVHQESDLLDVRADLTREGGEVIQREQTVVTTNRKQ